jgi:immune inhibitor A
MIKTASWKLSLLVLALGIVACAVPKIGLAPATPTPTMAPTLAPTPTATPLPTTTPEVIPDAVSGGEPSAPAIGPEDDRRLYQRVVNTELPAYDRVKAAIWLKGISPDEIPSPPSEPAVIYAVGDHELFWVHNLTDKTYRQVEAQLMHISEHAYFWVDVSQIGYPVDWGWVGDRFDHTYDVVRETFGTEVSPGVDGDPRLYILNSNQLGGVGGYFGAINLLPRMIDPYSNEHEMFFISIHGTESIGASYYNQTLAHEFQHMIHDNMDQNEEGWLDEGLAQLAQQIAGMRGDEWALSYVADPDQSMWYWGSEGSDYGQSYLFADYLFERFGQGFISALVANPANGFVGINRTLTELGHYQTVEEVYGDFMVALVFNDPTIGDGRYAFLNTDPGHLSPVAELSPGDSYEGQVNQYGIDVVRVIGSGPANIIFTGAPDVSVVPTYPFSGNYVWWSNRGDSTFSTLTREFDLTDVNHATFKFAAWYNLETDWDYAYVMASTDGGQTWDTLPTNASSTTNPNGTNYGSGMTGASGSLDYADWVSLSVNLDDYAGQKVLIRFAMINDEAVHEEGVVIDDISIPQIDFFDDVESGESSWIADGWIRMHNRIPQLWRVNVGLTGGFTTIAEMEIVDGQGKFGMDLDAVDEILLIITGQTQRTTVTAPYLIEVE